MANSVDPDQMRITWHLIWVYTVCSGLSVPISRTNILILQLDIHDFHLLFPESEPENLMAELQILAEAVLCC